MDSLKYQIINNSQYAIIFKKGLLNEKKISKF